MYEDYLRLKNSGIQEIDSLDELSTIGASFSVLDQLLRTSKEESKVYLATTIWSLARCPYFLEKLGEVLHNDFLNPGWFMRVLGWGYT